jgi:hypothetical protein
VRLKYLQSITVVPCEVLLGLISGLNNTLLLLPWVIAVAVIVALLMKPEQNLLYREIYCGSTEHTEVVLSLFSLSTKLSVSKALTVMNFVIL